jgi:hypothetical protein
MATLNHTITWDEVARPDFGTAERQIWRSTVADVTQRAKAAMDASLHGRIDKACALVLAGDVELLEGGKARVASQTNGTTVYHVVNGTCTCKDFPKVVDGWCKHRLASAIAKRTAQVLAIADARIASEQTPAEPAPSEAPATPLPEAPASVNCYVTLAGRQVQVTLRDTDEHRLLARLTALLSQYPVPDAPQAEAHGKDWCSKHGVSMKLNHKEGRSWYSHQVNGAWCKG